MNTIKFLKKGSLLLFFFLFATFSSVHAALNCSGTIYFKAPENWARVYALTGTRYTELTNKNADGWFTINTANITATGRPTTFFLTNRDGEFIDAKDFPTKTQTNANALSCDDFNKTTSLYIYSSSDGKTLLSNTEPAFTLYVLIPETSGWMTGAPMLSRDGGKTGERLKTDKDRCGWFFLKFPSPPDSVILFRSNNIADQIGLNGLSETSLRASNIPMKKLFDSLSTDALFFIPDKQKWPDNSSSGWFVNDPGVSGVCEYSIAAYIYDSDQSVNTLFSSSDDGSLSRKEFELANACRGIQHGVVADTLDENNKPVLNVGSENAKKCFNNDTTLFNKLFNYRPGINEVTCFELTFTRDTLSRWTFNSDDEMFEGYRGGFYPVEWKEDSLLTLLEIDGKPQVACEACRTRRTADGPVPNLGPNPMNPMLIASGITDYDKACNGPTVNIDGKDSIIGWNKGIDCSGYNIGGDLGQWGDRSWSGQKRNEQYCFESHATFVYDSTQEFSFRGDDDIWVFIAGRLAVDNGGAHWSSPGFVELKNFVDKDKKPLVSGKTYPIDIFFCDRMTTMTNVLIRTNMYITQQVSVEFNVNDINEETDFVDYEICFEKTAGSSSNRCGSSLSTSSERVRHCGKEIKDSLNLDILYTLTTREGEMIDTLDEAKVWYGGIDLSDTNYYHPSINDLAISGLAPGSYRLWIEVGGKKTYMNFRVTGTVNVDVANRDMSVLSATKTYQKGTVWKFTESATAGTLLPVYVSKIQGNSFDLSVAAGQNYRIYYDDNFNGAIYSSKSGGSMVTSRTLLKIDSTGVDTLWVTIPMNSMRSSSDTVHLHATSLRATLVFLAPILTFAENIVRDSSGKVVSWTPVIGDPDSLNGTPYSNWIGSEKTLSLIALNAADSSFCSECSFEVLVKDKSSGLVVSTDSLKNGIASVRVSSSKEFDDPPASLDVSHVDNPDLVFAHYGNMRFRKPPVPYPIIAELYDVRGEPLSTTLDIPSPYHNPGKEYLDGIADSLRLIFDRALKADSLPKFLCVEWDKEKYFKTDVRPKLKRFGAVGEQDSSVVCSDTLGIKEIERAWKDRKSDSILTFSGYAFSKNLKTSGGGIVRAFMAFKNYGRDEVQSFDGKIAEKIAPIILSAHYKLNEKNRELTNISVEFSEPVKISDSSLVKKAWTFYMPSADYNKDERLDTPKSEDAPELFDDSARTIYRHTSGRTIYKTPVVGDYVRFAEKVLSDTLGNFPTGLDASVPSPWAVIGGDLQLKVTVGTKDYGEYDASDPLMQERARNKQVTTIALFPPGDSISAVFSCDSLSGTVGHWIQVDLPEIYEKYKNIDDSLGVEDLRIYYSAFYFTNIGNFVAHETRQIECTDESIFGEGENCITNPGNFYIGWNGISNEGRLVGSGVYISSFTWLVQIGNYATRANKIQRVGLRRLK